MGLAVDSGIKPLDVGIPMLRSKYEVWQLNTTHQLSNVMLHNSTCVFYFIIFIIENLKCVPLEAFAIERLSNNMHIDKYGTKKHTSNEITTKYIGRWMVDILLSL